MAKSKNNAKKLSYISVPSQIISSLSSSSLQSLLLSLKNSSKNTRFFTYKNPTLWFLALFLFGLVGMLKLGFGLDPLIPFFPYRCFTTQSQAIISYGYSHSEMGLAKNDENGREEGVLNNYSLSKTLTNEHLDDEKGEFWKQPDGLGYKPCLKFTRDYQKASAGIVNDRRRYLMVVVSGGMNQQRNQIVDIVVIARILGATLVVPVLQVNVIWGDESKFSDIFDLEHFKKVLANDVHVVSLLPSTLIMSRPVKESRTHASPSWIRSRYSRRFNRDGVLLLQALDSRLSNDLPSDLQKLRCKVAFHALRFVPPILELGNKLAERMRSKGPYLALHLRMEKDVWVRTGCLPGLSHEYDEMINNERKRRPELLTARSNMTYHDRKLAGLCPLNAFDVTRLLKALGAPSSAKIYWAGGEPLGGKEALIPITREFPNFYNKEDLALPGELEPFAKRASVMAAIDYIVSENSDVFMPSHGGNMGHAIQGHRAYLGHKKYITPNKRRMLPYFQNSTLPEQEFNAISKYLHRNSLGQPDLRTGKAERDVTKYPAPACMCNDSHAHSRA